MRKSHTARIGWLAIVVSMLASLAAAPSASAAAGDPSVDQCFSSNVLPSCTQITPPFVGMDPVLSPDGRHLYMLGREPTFIRVFDRGANNRLIPRAGSTGCYNANGTVGCTPATGFTGGDVYDLEISPEGTSIYIAGGGSLAHLQRNPATGTLTSMQCYGATAGCTPIAPVSAVFSIAVSNDGQNLYTRGGDTFGAFERNPLDGTLTPEPAEDCFSETPTAGCTNTYGLANNGFEMAFSPDGKFLYYPIQTPGGIGFFQRTANGALTQISGPQGGCITTDGSSSAPGECATISDGSGPAMSNGWAATVSPSGRFTFISGDNGTVAFSRDPESGKLTKVDCIAPGVITACKQRSGSSGMGVAVSPDGKRAIVGSDDIGGVGVYDFDEATGTLTQLPAPLGCFSSFATPGCEAFPGGAGWGKVSWAPDGLNFYAIARGPLANMVVDAAPVCQSRAVAVQMNLSAVAALSCSDSNGDPVTLQISRPPTAGVLAGIDQAGSSVRYNPFSGYVGLDSFGYQGVARGVASAEATVTLDVQVPPAPPAAGKAAITSAIRAAWKPFATHTTVKRLLVANAPLGAQVRLSCKGKGCPFATKTIRVKKAGKVNLVRKFNFIKKIKGKKRKVVSKLRVGTTVEVQVNARDRVGKAVRYKMRKNKQPSSRTFCIPPGSTKPRARC